MPRFMLLVIPAAGAHTQEDPPLDAVQAMGRYNEELTRTGTLLAADGLRPPDEAARISFPGGSATVTDGPFAEAKELVGGYWIIQAGSRDEAIEWATRAPMRGGETIEVRQIAELEDFSEEFRSALQDG
jgi:hypothetical protein